MRMRINPDLESIKSVPILSVIRKKQNQSHSRLSINIPSQFEIKLRSHASSQGFQPYWKDIIHPQVLEKYEQLLQQGGVQDIKKKSRFQESPIKKYRGASRVKEESTKTHLIERVKSLQQQNINLREELYYLREALLLNFQSRQKNLHQH